MIKEIIGIFIQKNNRTYHLSDSNGNQADITDATTLLNFLLIGAENPSIAKCVWNLYQLWEILTKLLPHELSDKLTKDDRAFYGEFKIFSSAGKVLSIGYTKHLHDNFYAQRIETNTYSLRQFFPDFQPKSLEELMSKANELMHTLKDLNWNVSSLSSAIKIYDEAVLSREFVPSVYDMEDSAIMDEMLGYAYKMMCREWRTVYKVGNFSNATDIDIRSGYPSIIKDFGNTSEYKVKYAKKLIQSDFGICKGKLHLNQDYHPVVNARGQNVVGDYEDYITTEQWGYITKYGIGTFEMEDGYFLTFDHPDDKPFEALMNNLYSMREFGGLRKTLAKNISVGVYGYMSQEYPERYGNYFNPLYSIMCTSRCSLKIGKLIETYNLKPNLISVTVDGLLIDKDIDLDTTNVIGGWKKEQVNALVLSVGHQYIESADKSTKDAYQNSYQSMIAEIEAHPSKTSYGKVLLNKNMAQTNRVFKSYPRSGRDLLNNVYESESIKD